LLSNNSNNIIYIYNLISSYRQRCKTNQIIRQYDTATTQEKKNDSNRNNSYDITTPAVRTE